MIHTTNRFLGAALAAASVTAAMFWVMTALIRVEGAEIPPDRLVKLVFDVYVEPPEQPVETIRKRPVRKAIPDPEPLPPLKGEGAGPSIMRVKHAGPGPLFEKGPGNEILTNPDGDAVPLVRVPPRYPARAMAGCGSRRRPEPRRTSRRRCCACVGWWSRCGRALRCPP